MEACATRDANLEEKSTNRVAESDLGADETGKTARGPMTADLAFAMAGLGTLTDAESAEYADKVRALYGEYLLVGRTSTKKALEIGDLLNQVKKRLPHGEFLPWFKREIEERGGYKGTRRKQFMKLARKPAEKRAEYALLPLTDALIASGILKVKIKTKSKKKPGGGAEDPAPIPESKLRLADADKQTFRKVAIIAKDQAEVDLMDLANRKDLLDLLGDGLLLVLEEGRAGE